MSRQTRRITGHDNRTTGQQWMQIDSSDGKVTANFWMLKCIDTGQGATGVLSVLTARQAPTDALTWITTVTKDFYQDVEYTGSFTEITVTSGIFIIYLTGM